MFTKTDIENYFSGEKKEIVFFILAGSAGIITGLVFFFFPGTLFCKGAAVPLVIIGLLLAIVGYTIYTRSDEDRKRNVYAFDMNPAELKEKEWPRMRSVMKSFVVYRYTEIFLFLLGTALFIYDWQAGHHGFRKGLGAGLAVMAAIAVTADYFAERRGRKYIQGIESFIHKS